MVLNGIFHLPRRWNTRLWGSFITFIHHQCSHCRPTVYHYQWIKTSTSMIFFITSIFFITTRVNFKCILLVQLMSCTSSKLNNEMNWSENHLITWIECGGLRNQNKKGTNVTVTYFLQYDFVMKTKLKLDRIPSSRKLQTFFWSFELNFCVNSLIKQLIDVVDTRLLYVYKLHVCFRGLKLCLVILNFHWIQWMIKTGCMLPQTVLFLFSFISLFSFVCLIILNVTIS